jgi:hypothetical protein
VSGSLLALRGGGGIVAVAVGEQENKAADMP